MVGTMTQGESKPAELCPDDAAAHSKERDRRLREALVAWLSDVITRDAVARKRVRP